MRETTLHLAIIAVVAATVFFFNLGQARLWDRDEPRNAGCAAEMLQRGDLVVPIFNDQLRHQKPVLQYWLTISAYQLFGVNEFAARFWSALLATGTLLATYCIGRILFDPRTGLIGAIALASSLMFAVAARAATPDSVLMFCVTTALALFVVGTHWKRPSTESEPPCFPTDYRWAVSIYAMLGLAILAKGPVGFLLPMATMGLYGLVAGRQRRSAANRNWIISTWQFVWSVVRPNHFLKTLWRMRPISAAVIALAVAAPWFVLVHLRTEGDFTRLFFIGEHFGRATTTLENHGGGIWFYPLAILVGFFPWSCLWGPTLISMITANRTAADTAVVQSANVESSGRALLVCWVLVQVGAFSIVQTKLPSYVTPCYPALALLTAWGLRPLWGNGVKAQPGLLIHRGWHLVAFLALAISGLLITGGLWWAMGEYLPTLQRLALLGLIPLAGGLILIWICLSRRWQYTGLVYAITSVAFVASLLGLGTVAVDGSQSSQRVLDPIRASADVPVAAYGCLESSWVFYGQHRIIELNVMSDQVPPSAKGNRPSRVRDWEPIPRESPADFAHNPDALILTTDEHLDSLQKQLPPEFRVQASAPYFLKPERTLYLLSTQHRTAAHQDATAGPKGLR